MRIPVTISTPGLFPQYMWNPWGRLLLAVTTIIVTSYLASKWRLSWFWGPWPTLALTLALTLTLTLTLTLQEDINLLSKGKGLSKGKCHESKFILFLLATKKYYI